MLYRYKSILWGTHDWEASTHNSYKRAVHNVHRIKELHSIRPCMSHTPSHHMHSREILQTKGARKLPQLSIHHYQISPTTFLRPQEESCSDVTPQNTNSNNMLALQGCFLCYYLPCHFRQCAVDTF